MYSAKHELIMDIFMYYTLPQFLSKYLKIPAIGKRLQTGWKTLRILFTAFYWV